MRVISGIAKGRILCSFNEPNIRPTSDRARESLFNILGQKLINYSFLDLFAGSGAVGIEALSRNAENVVFVEISPASIALIKKNLEKCGFLNQGIKIIKKDALLYLKNCRKQFDIIFIDPPYQTNLAEKALTFLSEKKLLSPDGVIVLEHYFKKTIKDEFNGLQCVKRKKIGDTAFSFFTPMPPQGK